MAGPVLMPVNPVKKPISRWAIGGNSVAPLNIKKVVFGIVGGFVVEHHQKALRAYTAFPKFPLSESK